MVKGVALMLTQIRSKFTRWYIRQGYTMRYNTDNEMVLDCPKWVLLLTIFFFSPSVYMHVMIIDFIEPVYRPHEFLSKTLNVAEVRSDNMIEIYLNDLTPEKQRDILDILGDNGNYDVIPIATIEIVEEEEKEK